MTETFQAISRAASKLSRELESIPGLPMPPAVVGADPTDYCWFYYRRYLERAASGPRRCLIVGMNPSPHGQAQTGVPFGDVSVANRILGPCLDSDKPTVKSIDDKDGPKLVIAGLDYHRGEESGSRLWSAIEQSCGGLDAALERVCVINHCPLVFLDGAGRNVAPDKWPKTAEPVRRMREACDEHLLAVTLALAPEHIVALGTYANQAVERLIDSDRLGWAPKLHRLRHPSPLAGSAEDFSVAAISLLSRICEVTP